MQQRSLQHYDIKHTADIPSNPQTWTLWNWQWFWIGCVQLSPTIARTHLLWLYISSIQSDYADPPCYLLYLLSYFQKDLCTKAISIKFQFRFSFTDIITRYDGWTSNGPSLTTQVDTNLGQGVQGLEWQSTKTSFCRLHRSKSNQIAGNSSKYSVRVDLGNFRRNVDGSVCGSATAAIRSEEAKAY